MKVSILYKILLLSIIPILTLSIFSYTYFSNSFLIIQNEKKELINLTIINSARELLYNIEKERTLSTAYASDLSIDYNKSDIKSYIKNSNLSIDKFQKTLHLIEKDEVLSSVKKQIHHINKMIEKTASLRELVKQHEFNADEVIELYSLLNDSLVSLIHVTDIQTNSRKLNFDIKTMFMLIQYQEYAGKQRAIVTNILNNHKTDIKKTIPHYEVSSLQYAQEQKLRTVLRGLPLEKKLASIKNKYSNNLYESTLKNINKKNNTSSSEWIKISTQRINEINKIQTQLFIDISKDINDEIQNLTNDFTTQLLISITTIFLLIFSTFIISRKINASIILETKNLSLEKTVNSQTMELQKQIIELTKARDTALSAQIAKDEFLANMSHEIRTPLNAILGFITILQKRLKDKDNLSYLSIVESSGNSLLAIINDILDFSKIQSGKFIITKYEINPLDEFADALSIFNSKIYEKNIAYAVYIDPNLPNNITIDFNRTKQILLNLLSNAIKFTPVDGEIKVKITLEENHLIILVQDNGIGIAKQNHHKIFSSFEQADNSTTRKFGGTGLGLSISHRLAELMGGELSFKSEIDKGSVFTLSLPCQFSQDDEKSILSLTKYSNLKIAILGEANSVFIKLIKKYLNSFGFNDVVLMKSYQKQNYDILFFVPDDDYNEEIVNAHIPAIAMLRDSTIKLTSLKHLQALYTPFSPKSILKVIEKLVELEPIKDELDTNKTIVNEKFLMGKVLVAEDNKTNQMLISLLLSEYGIDVVMADDGLKAVEAFKKESFDMVLMDENMPNLNGIEALNQIRLYENENKLKSVPIIALTANALENDRKRFLDAGMDGFIAKPIDNKVLESELSKYLKRL